MPASTAAGSTQPGAENPLTTAARNAKAASTMAAMASRRLITAPAYRAHTCGLRYCALL